MHWRFDHNRRAGAGLSDDGIDRYLGISRGRGGWVRAFTPKCQLASADLSRRDSSIAQKRRAFQKERPPLLTPISLMDTSSLPQTVLIIGNLPSQSIQEPTHFSSCALKTNPAQQEESDRFFGIALTLLANYPGSGRRLPTISRPCDQSRLHPHRRTGVARSRSLAGSLVSPAMQRNSSPSESPLSTRQLR